MPRLGKRSAGDLVAARLTQFSADLLAQERACFAAIDSALADAVPSVEQAVRAAWRQARGHPGADRRLRTALDGVLLAVEANARKPVTRLARVGGDLALESIGDELRHCERTLPDRFAGITGTAVQTAEALTPDLTRRALTQYTEVEPAAAAMFAGDALRQLTLSADHREPLQTLLGRLTRLDGPNLPGLTARGVWWRPATSLQAAARHAVIGLTNAVREAAMVGMNTAHTTRQNS